ncbi:MAG: hypothetical protein GY878_19445 [Fuerstiella sp.]|nr:hypothetical protein [Fuerstiella sp.]
MQLPLPGKFQIRLFERYFEMTTRILRFVTCFVLLAVAAPARAGVILSFSTSSPTVIADGSGMGDVTIDVQAAADTGTQSLKGYDLFVDLTAPAGTDPPVGWSVSTPLDVAKVSSGSFFSETTNPGEGDVAASDLDLFGSGITLTETPTTLWSFTASMDSGSGATDEIYGANFLTGGGLSLTDGGGGRHYDF